MSPQLEERSDGRRERLIRGSLNSYSAVIVELKCCEHLAREHQAQLFNYLKVARLPIGLLVNFRRRHLDWKRLQSNEDIFDQEVLIEERISF